MSETIVQQPQNDAQEPQEAHGQVDTPDASQEPAGEPQEAEESESGAPAREAQKLRKRLREAEAQRDEAQQMVQKLQSTIVDKELDGQRVTPDALWAAGHTADQFITDDGQIDHGALSAAVKETGKKFGIPLTNTPMPDPSQGHGMGNRYANGSWESAFAPDGLID